MARSSARLWSIVVLGVSVVGLAAAGMFVAPDIWAANILYFIAWSAAVVLIFVLALGLPLRARGARYRAVLWNIVLAAGAISIGCMANVAVYRHDAHIDASREGINSPPPQLGAVLRSLGTDVALTYFYNADDVNALKVKELLTIASRQYPHLRFRAIDLDKDPAVAREFGVRAYNTSITQAEGRRVVVDNSVDLAQVAYAIIRVLRTQVDIVCLATGHGEGAPADSAHVHYSHVETLQGHEVPGAGDVLQGDPDGLDKLQLAMTTLGYTVRKIVPATETAIPSDCSVVAEIGPRQAMAPNEAGLLERYLAGGGRLLLMIDPDFPIGPELDGVLAKVGLASKRGTVIDPLNHYGTEDDKVAVPYYPPHPITDRLALTIFPNARSIHLGSAPAGVAVSVLASSSKDSYLRPPSQTADAAGQAPASDRNGAERGVRVLAAAVQGRWPDAPTDANGKPFRLVIVGDSNFAANSYFGYVSNGDLALRMVRWLAGDQAMAPVRPQTLTLDQIVLTSQQMRNIFLLVELLLPLSVVLFGCFVWWRRR